MLFPCCALVEHVFKLIVVKTTAVFKNWYFISQNMFLFKTWAFLFVVSVDAVYVVGIIVFNRFSILKNIICDCLEALFPL